MPETLLWSIAETARQLGGVSKRTIERMIEDGELSVIRIRKLRMIEADVVRRWLSAQNDHARARMEERPCQEKTVTASTSNRGRRTGTGAIPMRTDAAADAVRERITRLKHAQS